MSEEVGGLWFGRDAREGLRGLFPVIPRENREKVQHQHVIAVPHNTHGETGVHGFEGNLTIRGHYTPRFTTS